MISRAAAMAMGGVSSGVWQPRERLTIWAPFLTARIISQATATSLAMQSLSIAR
jgi:hypothetical protein